MPITKDLGVSNEGSVSWYNWEESVTLPFDTDGSKKNSSVSNFECVTLLCI